MHNYKKQDLRVSQSDNQILSMVTLEHGIRPRNRFLTTFCEEHVNPIFTR